MLSLIKEMNPPSQYHTRGTHHTLSAAHWVYDVCLEGGLVSTLNNHLCDAVAVGLLNHTNWYTVSISQSSQVRPASMQQTQCKPPPPSLPPRPSLGRCQSYLLALGWMEGAFPDYIHCDTACVYMCVCVHAGCFSVTHAPSVILGNGRSSPCLR